MKALFWIGLVVLILGLASLVVPIPQREREGISVGGVSLGVETRHEAHRGERIFRRAAARAVNIVQPRPSAVAMLLRRSAAETQLRTG